MSATLAASHDLLEEIRILHVDDEPSFADMAATFIQREDDRFTVESATSASDGLDRLDTEQFDCVVSDYDMPERNGIDFLESVRETHPDLPFILFTGKGSEEIASDAISAGVTDYLQKGTDTSQYELLANRITNVVEQFRSRRAITETEQKLSQLAEHTDDVLFMFNGDWSELLFINSSYEEIWGGSIDELRDDLGSFLEYIHPDDRQNVSEAMAQIRSGESIDIEYRVRRPDGEQRWINGKTKPIFDEKGAVSRIVGYVRDITERKERERELQRKERRYQAIFNDPNILIGLIDTDGTVRDINRTALEYIDAALEDLTGEPFWETPWFDHSETVQEEVKDWIDRAAAGEYVEFEVDLVRSDGEPYTIAGVFRPVTNDAGEVVSLLISDRDITERKRHEQELHRAKRAMDRAPAGITITDPDREDNPLIYVNDHFSHLTGYTKAEIIGRNCRFLQGENTDPETTARLRGAIDTERPVTVELRNYRKDGSEFWNRLSITPVYDEEGSLVNYVGFQEDVTERKEREQQLEALNRISQELMSADTRDEVIEIGVETTRDLLGIEANAIHLYDEDAEALVPATVTDAASDLVGEPPTFRGDDSIAWRVYQRGETLACDTVSEDPDRAARSKLYLPLGEYGILLAGSPSLETFDEQMVLLGKILAGGLATALEQVERTEQLRARDRELTAQNARLEDFASIVSHDLRNPLTVASGRLELVAAECDSDHVEHIEQAHERMRTLIDDLLSLAREGEAATDVEPVALAPLVGGCWATVGTEDATLVTDIERTVQADKSRLKQLFENLIRNAIEHGGEDVTVTIGELDDGFYIEDDGSGIPADEHETIFEAGYSTSEDGTGFGLSIVNQVVEAHDWRVHVTDGDEGGARFEITGVEVAAE